MTDTDDVKARLASEYGLNPHGAGGSICHGDIVIMDNYNAEELLALLDHITAPLEARIAELEARILALGDAAFAGASNIEKLEAENAKVRLALRKMYRHFSDWPEYHPESATTETAAALHVARAALQQKGQENV